MYLIKKAFIVVLSLSVISFFACGGGGGSSSDTSSSSSGGSTGTGTGSGTSSSSSSSSSSSGGSGVSSFYSMLEAELSALGLGSAVYNGSGLLVNGVTLKPSYVARGRDGEKIGVYLNRNAPLSSRVVTSLDLESADVVGDTLAYFNNKSKVDSNQGDPWYHFFDGNVTDVAGAKAFAQMIANTTLGPVMESNVTGNSTVAGNNINVVVKGTSPEIVNGAGSLSGVCALLVDGVSNDVVLLRQTSNSYMAEGSFTGIQGYDTLNCDMTDGFGKSRVDGIFKVTVYPDTTNNGGGSSSSSSSSSSSGGPVDPGTGPGPGTGGGGGGGGGGNSGGGGGSGGGLKII